MILHLAAQCRAFLPPALGGRARAGVLLAALLAGPAPGLGAETAPAGNAPAASTAARPLPSPAEVLARCLDAMGGRSALEGVTTCVAVGSTEATHLGASVPTRLLARAPDQRRLTFDVPGYGRVEEVCDGRKGWQSDPVFGRTEWSGKEWEARRRAAAFLPELQLLRLYPDLRVAGAESLGSQAVWVLEAGATSESRDRFYFSRKTGLLLRHDSQFPGALGPVTRSVSFSEHRKFDAVLLPARWEVRQRSAGQAEPEVTFRITFGEVRLNTPLDDAQFGGPAGQP